MKRFFILATAAIVALASCAKTEVVYKDAPEEIVLKTVNMPMTKAAYDQNLGVAAYKLDGTSYFPVTEFTLSSNVWTGGQFWPLDTKLAFVGYGPFDGATGVEITTSVGRPNGMIVTGVESDVDFVYSVYVDNSGAGYGKGAEVPMPLYHTKAKIVINVQNGSNETVTKVELLEPNDGGNCTITFPDHVTWNGYTNTNDFDFTSVNTHYVVPGTPTTLRITYDSAEPAKTGLTAEIALADETMYDSEGNEVTGAATWKAGYSYRYDVTIQSELITIKATEAAWTEQTNIVPEP